MIITDFSKYLTNFLTSYLPNFKNVSKHTLSSYCDTFRLFLTYLRDKDISIEKFTINDLGATLVEKFLTWIEQERHCSVATRNQRLAAIHSFVRYVQVESPKSLILCQRLLDIPFKKSAQRAINHISEEDMKLILSLPNVQTIQGKRDLMLLSLMYDTGARVQEIIDLKVKDVRLEHPAKVTLTGKGRKMRDIPLLSRTVALLEQYLTDRQLTTVEKLEYPLFVNRQGSKFTRVGIAYILSKYAEQAKRLSTTIPDTISPHVLRHTKAMHLLKAGINIIYIRDILGHSSINTTEIYARINLDLKRQALETLTPVVPTSTPHWANDSDLMTWLKNYGQSSTPNM